MKFDGIKRSGPDLQIEDSIESLCNRYGIGPIDAIKLWTVLTRRQWMKRFLAHVELFKQSLDIPGDIADLGVFHGASLMTWANLLECYSVGSRTKIVYGFDNWKGFTAPSPQDGVDPDYVNKSEGGFSPGTEAKEQLLSAINIFDSDRFVSWKQRVRLIEGDIQNTVPAFISENIGVRLSLVHFDCDLYEPTKVALEYIWPRVSRGGVVIFDEYAIHDWAGETKAVDEYFQAMELKLKCLPWTNSPAAYLIKP